VGKRAELNRVEDVLMSESHLQMEWAEQRVFALADGKPCSELLARDLGDRSSLA
jgi:hypothetical protein